MSLPPFSHYRLETKLLAYPGLAKAQKFISVDNLNNLIYPLNLLVISILSVHFIKAIGILYVVQWRQFRSSSQSKAEPMIWIVIIVVGKSIELLSSK